MMEPASKFEIRSSNYIKNIEYYFDPAPLHHVIIENLPQPTRFTREQDIRLLAMTCFAEAQTESEFGKILVMATLINRAEKRGTTLLAELARPHQFPWWGRVRRTSEQCENLARMYVLNHEHTNVTHFHHRRIRPSWAQRNNIQFVEGNHIFYRIEN